MTVEQTKLLINFWVLSILFVSFSLLLAIVFKKIWTPSKRSWKGIEIFFLSMSFVGILGVCQRAETIIKRIELDNEVYRLPFYKQVITDKLELLRGSAICRKFIKTESSPSNLGEIQNEFDETCNFFKTYSPAFEKKLNNDSSIDESTFAKLSKDPIIQEDIKYLNSYIAEYNQLLTSIKEKQQDNPSDILIFLVMFSPLILTFSLALRVSKAIAQE